MIKNFLLLASAMIIVGGAYAANNDTTTTLPLNATAITNDYDYTVGGAGVEFLTVANTASFSNTVQVLGYSGGITTCTLYSGTLTAGSTATVYPVRAFDDGQTTNRCYVVSGVRAIVTSASGLTNATTGPVRIFIQSPQAP